MSCSWRDSSVRYRLRTAASVGHTSAQAKLADLVSSLANGTFLNLQFLYIMRELEGQSKVFPSWQLAREGGGARVALDPFNHRTHAIGTLRRQMG